MDVVVIVATAVKEKKEKNIFVAVNVLKKNMRKTNVATAVIVVNVVQKKKKK